MLKKLLKYEFKATGRIMVLIYLAVLAVAVVTGLLGRTVDWNAAVSNPILLSVFFVTYIILIVAMFILTLFLIIERFYKNMLRGEGYLMHTLPVPTWMLIVSKLISAFVWEILAVAVLLLSVFFCTALGGGLDWSVELFYAPGFFEAIRDSAGLVTLILVVLIVQLIRVILLFYASMAIGGSATRHKLAYSFLAFVIIVIVMNVISLVVNLGAVINITVSSALMTAADQVQAESVLTGLLTKQLVSDLIFAAVFFLITHYFLKKKLNLE